MNQKMNIKRDELIPEVTRHTDAAKIIGGYTVSRYELTKYY